MEIWTILLISALLGIISGIIINKLFNPTSARLKKQKPSIRLKQESLTMPIKSVIIASVIGGVVGLIIAMVILPALVVNLETTLDSLDIVDTSNLIGWLSEIIIFVILSGVTILLAKYYKWSTMLTCLISSFLYGVVLLCVGSFWYIVWDSPQLFHNMSLWAKLWKWYAYPNVVSILIGTPQSIWVISTIVHIILFNLKFYQLVELQ